MLATSTDPLFNRYNLYASAIKLLRRDEDSALYQMTCPDGTGLMTRFMLFPGVDLFFNDFHAFHCQESGGHSAVDALEINHCRRGRYECRLTNGFCSYLGENDLAATIYNTPRQMGAFTLGYYEGVEIMLDLPVASQSLSALMGDALDLAALKARLTAHHDCAIFRESPAIHRICDDFYTARGPHRRAYYRIKVLELLFFLTHTPIDTAASNVLAYPEAFVAKIKTIAEALRTDLQAEHTLKELAATYDLGLTRLKSGFKAVYGKTPAAYRREYRLQHAATLLKRAELPIAAIAEAVGYDNFSKFSEAFKAYTGLTPRDYRRKSSDSLE